jgi:hypothetical protein
MPSRNDPHWSDFTPDPWSTPVDHNRLYYTAAGLAFREELKAEQNAPPFPRIRAAIARWIADWHEAVEAVLQGEVHTWLDFSVSLRPDAHGNRAACTVTQCTPKRFHRGENCITATAISAEWELLSLTECALLINSRLTTDRVELLKLARLHDRVAEFLASRRERRNGP